MLSYREKLMVLDAAINELRGRPVNPSANASRICLVAPSRFRLWDDAGGVLAETPASNGMTVLMSKMLLQGTTRRAASGNSDVKNKSPVVTNSRRCA